MCCCQGPGGSLIYNGCIWFSCRFHEFSSKGSFGSSCGLADLLPITALFWVRVRVADMRQAEPDLVLIQPVFIFLALPRTQKPAHILSHTRCSGCGLCMHVPLGMALSVSLLPLSAFSSSLVLSWAAFTRSFSPATLAAFPTNMQTRNGEVNRGRMQEAKHICYW